METRNLTTQEWEALQVDLQEIYKKHNVEMYITSTIQFKKIESQAEGVPSPFIVKE